MAKCYLIIIFSGLFNLNCFSQYSRVSEFIPLKKSMDLVKENKVASITRLRGNGTPLQYPAKRIFDKNGFLKAFYHYPKQNGISTFETDSLGRVIKSYSFKYPKTEEYTSYSTFVLDSFGNRIKQEHFYANGERYHFSESHKWSDKDFVYWVDVEAGKDSSIIRIAKDTLSKISSYIDYRDGKVIDVDTYFTEFNEKGQKIRYGKIDYQTALWSWWENNSDELENQRLSFAYTDSLINFNRLDTALFEYTVNETYTYYDEGAIKRIDDYFGIREYEYNAQGFPIKVTKYERENKIESTVIFKYHENGLLERETTTLPDGVIRTDLIYEYTFW